MFVLVFPAVQSINDDLNASLATADELSKEFNSLLKEVSSEKKSGTEVLLAALLFSLVSVCIFKYYFKNKLKKKRMCCYKCPVNVIHLKCHIKIH